MDERTGQITFKGEPLTLLGEPLSAGQPAPDATLVANDMTEVQLSEFRGKVCVICAVPSLDTPVCDTETRRFNEAAASLGDNVVILTVSMDLPFAQERWCGAAGVKAVRTLSDYRDREFGRAYGVLIKELGLLARAVFVVDDGGTVRYVQWVKEIASEPDYEAALGAVRKLT